MYDTWHRVANLIELGVVNPAPVITHKMDMERFDDAIAVAKGGRGGKVVLFP